MPPPVAQEIIGSLGFLISDCRQKTIDNSEAVHRYMQIALTIEEQSRSIVVAQDVVSVAGMGNALSQIRIGSVFCAVVDDKGESCALWTGNDSLGVAQWYIVSDKSLAQRLHQALLVRQGKTIPAFIELPLCGADSALSAKGQP